MSPRPFFEPEYIPLPEGPDPPEDFDLISDLCGDYLLLLVPSQPLPPPGARGDKLKYWHREVPGDPPGPAYLCVHLAPGDVYHLMRHVEANRAIDADGVLRSCTAALIIDAARLAETPYTRKAWAECIHQRLLSLPILRPLHASWSVLLNELQGPPA